MLKKASSIDVKERHIRGILAADIANFSRYMEQDEVQTIEILRKHRRFAFKQIDIWAGTVVNTAGDSIIAVFDSAVNSIMAAKAIQRGVELANIRTQSPLQLRYRIGIHLGEVVDDLEGNILGDDVNIAARIESSAAPGGIRISETMFAVLPAETRAEFKDAGYPPLKNISRPVGVFDYIDEKASKRPIETNNKNLPKANIKASMKIKHNIMLASAILVFMAMATAGYFQAMRFLNF